MFFSDNFSCVFVFFLLQIWIQPEHPKQLTAIFSNLTDVWLSCIFPECDLNWTLFILEVAPALQNFTVRLLLYLLVDTTHQH
jgi:hypothetical protein